MPKYPRKADKETQKEKPYCPSMMMRYDEEESSEYHETWMCRVCTRVILSKEAVRRHLLICNTQNKLPVQQPPTPTINTENTVYACKLCDRVFSRSVSLKYHVETHEKSESSDDSD